MRGFVAAMALLGLGALLSGCVAADVAGAAVGTAASAASTAADVTGDVVSGAADTVSGSGDQKPDDQNHKN